MKTKRRERKIVSNEDKWKQKKKINKIEYLPRESKNLKREKILEPPNLKEKKRS